MRQTGLVPAALLLLRAIEDHGEIISMNAPGSAHQDVTTTYRTFALDAPVDYAEFVFHPPQDARRIEDFPSAMEDGFGTSRIGDGNGEIEKLMGPSGIPRTVLVNPSGQIVYDASGADENRLRAHLSQLGPEFKDLAPKPATAPPCVASK